MHECRCHMSAAMRGRQAGSAHLQLRVQLRPFDFVTGLHVYLRVVGAPSVVLYTACKCRDRVNIQQRVEGSRVVSNAFREGRHAASCCLCHALALVQCRRRGRRLTVILSNSAGPVNLSNNEILRADTRMRLHVSAAISRSDASQQTWL